MMTGNVQGMLVARPRVYADAQLWVTADLKGVFQNVSAQGESEMAAIIGIFQGTRQGTDLCTSGVSRVRPGRTLMKAVRNYCGRSTTVW